MSILISSPLSVWVSKTKQFILNLNNYRNTHFRLLNQSKINYKEIITPQIDEEIYYPLKRIAIVYTVFKGDKKRFDIGNICSIHQKYFEDALVEAGKLPDDKSTNIPITIYTFGGVSKENPRVEIRIYDLTDKAQIKECNTFLTNYLTKNRLDDKI